MHLSCLHIQELKAGGVEGPTSFAGGVQQIARQAASQQAAAVKAGKPALMGLLSAPGASAQGRSVGSSALTALQMAQYQAKR